MIEKVDFAYGEIEDYIYHNERRPADYAGRLGVSVQQFFRMVAHYKELKLEEAKTEEAKAARERNQISDEARAELYAAAMKGASRKALGERFGIAQSTVHNIINKQKVLAEMRRDNQKAERKEAKREDSLPEAQPAVIGFKEDIAIAFEGDYLVLRVAKKNVTRTLLQGLL